MREQTPQQIKNKKDLKGQNQNFRQYIQSELISMRVKFSEKINEKSSPVKKTGNLLKGEDKNRIYPRQIYKNQYYRKVVINNSSTLTQILDPNTSRLEQVEEEKMKFKKEFDLQNGAKSENIIKNLSLRFDIKKTVFVQQDYECFLSEFPISQLSFQKRLKLFYGVAKGVRDLHSVNICHRSLNPQHICVVRKNEDFIAKINYFEKAVQLSSKKQTISDKAAGTIFLNRDYDQFSSPELRNENQYSLGADIWSLGCLLSYILYGTVENIWEQQQEVKIEVPQGTPKWLFQLLKLMLHCNPTRRHTINTVVDVIKVSLKCVEAMEKYVPLGSKNLKLNKTELKIE